MSDKSNENGHPKEDEFSKNWGLPLDEVYKVGLQFFKGMY